MGVRKVTRDNIEKMRVRGANGEDLFSLMQDYLKKTISEDLNRIYEKEASIVNEDEPWLFEMES